MITDFVPFEYDLHNDQKNHLQWDVDQVNIYMDLMRCPSGDLLRMVEDSEYFPG